MSAILGQPNARELSIAEQWLRTNSERIRDHLNDPNVSDTKAAMLDAMVANEVVLVHVANWLRSLIENVPVRVSLTLTDLRRARILYSLHCLAACSPISLCKLGDVLEIHRGTVAALLPDEEDAAGSLIALLGDLVELSKTGSVNETIGPVPAPFGPPVKRARHG